MKSSLLFKILAIVVWLSCALGAHAEYYGFKIGGVAVNSDNYTNVTGSTITTGSVSYDPDTKTVTLRNVTIKRTGSDNRAIYNESNTGLIVKLMGTNILNADDAAPVRFNASGSIVVESGTTSITGGSEGAIYSNNVSMSVSGPGTLKVKSNGGYGFEGKGSSSSSTLTLANINLDVESTKGALYDWSRVTFNAKSYVNLLPTNNSSFPIVSNVGAMTFYTASNGVNEAIRQPVGATYSTSSMSIVLNGTKVYNKTILITNNPDFKDGYIYYKITGTNTVNVTYKDTDGKDYINYVTIPSTATYDNVTYQVKGIGNSAFRNSADLYGVTIPSSVTSVGNSAFNSCINLGSITLSDAVTSVGNNAFKGCSGLGSATIGNGCTTIGDNAFDGCSIMSTVTIGSACTSIGENAFNGCNMIIRMNCNAMTPPVITSTTLPKDNLTLVVPTPAAVTLYQAADYWKNITNIIPAQPYDFVSSGIYYLITGTNTVSVTYNDGINYNSYSGSVNIPNTVYYSGKTYRVTGITESAFMNSTGLTSVTMPANMTVIGIKAFQGCTGLTSVTIPDGVTEIRNLAFNNCTRLSTLVIGSGCQLVGQSAFFGTALTQITCKAITPPMTYSTSPFQYYTATLTVPTQSVMAYRNTVPWKYFTIVGDQGEPFQLGDVNGDGEIDITDVTLLIDAVLTGDFSTVNTDAADCHADGEIDVSDVTALIDRVLNGVW